MIGEIVGIYCEEKYLSENEPDLWKMNAMMFFMPAGPYFRAGDFIAEAFKVGKDYRKRR